MRIDRLRIVSLGAVLWAALGGGLALGALPGVNGDVRVIVASLSVVFPAMALLASFQARHGHARRAGALLLVSAQRRRTSPPP